MPQLFDEPLVAVCENIGANQPLWFPDKEAGDDDDSANLLKSETYKLKVPQSDKKQEYIDYLLDKGIEVCNEENFCRAKYLIGAKIRLADVCPWVFGHQKITVRYTLSYSVGISNPVTSYADDVIEINDWEKRDPHHVTLTANDANFLDENPIFTDPENGIYFDHEPPPPTIHTVLEEIRTDPENLQEIPLIRLTATLDDGEWHTLAGQTVVQHIDHPCEYIPGIVNTGFQHLAIDSVGGGTYTIGWTMLGPDSVYSSFFTLVRGVILQVRSIGWGD